MNTRAGSRWLAGLVAASMVVPLFGCGNPNNNRVYGGSPPPYNAPQRNNGPLSNMTTKQKVALLVGAAALYYLYKKHQNAQGAGAQGQYYRSKNGGIYYRDAQGNPHWVTPPAGGIQVPADQAPMYEQGARQYGISASPPGPGGYSGGY